MTGRKNNHLSGVSTAWMEAVKGGWRLSPGFLYRTPKQAALWKAVHRAHAPVYSRTSIRDLFNCGRERWTARMRHNAHHVLAWACGTGDKEIAFSNHWPVRPESWTAVDISPELVKACMNRADKDLKSIPLSGKVFDFSRPDGDSPAKGMTGPCLHLLFGVLANQSPQWILRKMGIWMRPGDFLVASVNCLPADSDDERASILRQYDNPETRAWLAQALREVGIDPVAVNLTWDWEVSEEGWGWRLICRVGMKHAGAFHLPETTIPYEAKDTLELFSTNRFVLKSMKDWQPPPPLGLAESIFSTCGEEAILFLEIHSDLS